MKVQIPGSTILKEDRFKSKEVTVKSELINEMYAHLMLKIIFPIATISGTADTCEVVFSQ